MILSGPTGLVTVEEYSVVMTHPFVLVVMEMEMEMEMEVLVRLESGTMCSSRRDQW